MICHENCFKFWGPYSNVFDFLHVFSCLSYDKDATLGREQEISIVVVQSATKIDKGFLLFFLLRHTTSFLSNFKLFRYALGYYVLEVPVVI
jgi:hypothetical protein